MSQQLPSRICLAPLEEIEAPQVPVPAAACDTHAHVLGPFDRYPLVPDRSYTPPESLPEAYECMLERLGMERAVLVQPSVYGTDNRLVLEAVARATDRFRAVVVVDREISPAELRRMHDAGVRGFRINLLFRGGVALDTLEETARKAAELGWHAQLLVDIRGLPDIVQRLDRLPIPVVFDHMGHFPAELGTDWDGFRLMLGLAEREKAWIKISGAYRLSSARTPHDDVAPIARKLLREVPHRLTWGSDWPHVAQFDWMPDTGALFNAFARWCGSADVLECVLSQNPKQLYGFDQSCKE